MDLMNPVATPATSTILQPDLSQAERPLRIGILGNAKPNSAALLEAVRDILCAAAPDMATPGPMFEKIKAPIPASPEMMSGFEERADLVLVGSAD